MILDLNLNNIFNILDFESKLKLLKLKFKERINFENLNAI